MAKNQDKYELKTELLASLIERLYKEKAKGKPISVEVVEAVTWRT